jgi:hypothetical protein
MNRTSGEFFGPRGFWFFFPEKKNKKKTDPNPPVWTGLNEKIDI